MGAGSGALRSRLDHLLFGNPLYRLSLLGRRPGRLLLHPEDPWPGDPAQADALFRGRYQFAGEQIEAPNLPPWHPHGVSDGWMAALHGFAWLRDFAAAGGETAERHAAALVGSWLTRHRRWEPLVWRPDVIGRRLTSWFSHGGMLLSGAAPELQSVFLASAAMQSRHLARTAGRAAPGPGRLTAAGGLILAGLCLPGAERRLAAGQRLLERELAAQVLPDGGHVSRSPAVQLEVLRDLIALRGALIQGGVPVPEALQHAIDRMVPMLRTFRHGDGGLALFHGAGEQADGGVDLTLARAEVKGKPLTSAPHSGFERLSARRTLVLIDVGPPPPAASGVPGHAAPLAFELSIGRERLIVNCGATERQVGEWARAMRATAAHSTLTLQDSSAVALDERGFPAGGRPVVQCSRSEAEGSIWLEASHDGYQPRFGAVHRRRLYLDASGNELRGEDALLGAVAEGTRFAVRFHLHPQVHASLVQNGVAALLKLPNGIGFQLRAAGGALSLEESVYLGGGSLRRCEQIVISGATEGAETVVKWALTRLQANGNGGD